jgi:cytochrome c5
MKNALMSAIGGMILIVAAPTIAAADGQAIYAANCAACHNNMQPKLGDKGAWGARIKQGTDALVASVIKGKGAMPARGGHPKLSDDDVKAAVDYMVAQVK